MTASRRRATGEIAQLVRSRVRDVTDYPKPGVLFKDITPLLADPAAFALVIDALVDRQAESLGAASSRRVVDKVVGIEARGFILAAPVAYRLEAGFVPVRKKGKLPGPTYEQAYQLEYGEEVLAVHRDAVAVGDRVLVIDDVLATGGTAAATAALVERTGGEVVGCSVLLELAFLGGRARLAPLVTDALLTV